jgi:hypothetical protein
MAAAIERWMEQLKARLVARAPSAWVELVTIAAAGEGEPKAAIGTAIEELVHEGRLEMLTRGRERLYRRHVVEKSTTCRASWDEYFMRIAEVVASRATCDRKHVGAVIVRDKSILAT